MFYCIIKKDINRVSIAKRNEQLILQIINKLTKY